MPSIYDFYPFGSSAGSTADEHVWADANGIVTNLKLSGWITLGSYIISDSAVVHQSLTADGFDWWDGTSQLQGDGGGVAWHVLQSPAGIEMVITAEPGGGNAKIFWFFSMNGFSSAGLGSAWRGHDGFTSTRPNDIASSPAYGREFGARVNDRGHPAVTPMIVRKDGKGFIWHRRASDAGDAWEGSWAGLHIITSPVAGDRNPYVMTTLFDNLNISSTNGGRPSAVGLNCIYGRIDTHVVHHEIVEIGGVTTTVYPDDTVAGTVFGNEEVYPIAIYSDELGGFVRWTLSDVYRIRSTPGGAKWPYGTTFNNGTFMVVGNQVIPWNVPTVDNPAVIMPFSAFPPPQGAGMGFLKAFNLGMEVL